MQLHVLDVLIFVNSMVCNCDRLWLGDFWSSRFFFFQQPDGREYFFHSSAIIFFYYICAACNCNFFLSTSACMNFFLKIPPLQELNGRPLSESTKHK